MPRGPRRNLRPVPVSRSQPISVDVDRKLADRLGGVDQVEPPAARAIRPTSAAGLTSPPLVGTQVSPISLVRSPTSARQRGQVDRAGLVVGDHDHFGPVRRATRYASTPLPYSSRLVRMWSPGRNGIA